MERIATLRLDDSLSFVDDSAPRSARIRAPWHDGAVRAIAFVPGSSIVCSAGSDGAVRVWDVARSELRWQFERDARHLVAAPDGRLLYAVNEALEVWPIDLHTGDELDRVWAPSRRASRAHKPERTVLSPDGRWLLPACGDATGSAMLVDLATGASRTLEAPGAGETHPMGRFSDDGRTIWTLGGVRDGRSGRARSALYRFSLVDGACEDIRALRLLQQGGQSTTPLHRERCAMSERWLVVSVGREVLRWELANITAATWLDAGVDAVARTVTGERVFACAFSRDSAVAIGSHAKRALTTAWTLPSPEVASVLALSLDERTLAVGCASGRVARVPVDG